MADLLPSNATAQERALSEATARIDDIPVPVGTLWDPATCPAAVLPWLAWALSVDVWDATWTEAQKRATIAAAVQVHRLKGTRGAVTRAIAALGYDVTLYEWWENDPAGAPYTFRLEIEVDDRGVDDALYTTLERVVDRAKNTRSHLAEISVVAKSAGVIRFAGAPMLGDAVSVSPWSIAARETVSPFYVGMGVAAYDILTVNPTGA